MSSNCRKTKCKELKKCSCNKLPESCIVVVQRTPPLVPQFPPNTYTPQDVVTRSCLTACNRKCRDIVLEIYCTATDLQAAYQQLRRDKILATYADGVVYQDNGVLYVGKQQFLEGVLDPSLVNRRSINPDYSTLIFQISLLNCDSATQYGTYTTTFVNLDGTTSTLNRSVIITWVKHCGYWFILNTVSVNLLA
jgi:hypothetical protein